MRIRYRVRGRVQGVGYRWFVVRQARGLGLTGTVRNCHDGTVEVVAQGSATELRRLEAILGAGPVHANVTNVDQIEISDEGDLLSDFRIVR